MADIATSWDVANAVGDWSLAPPSLDLLVDERGNSIVDQNGQALASRNPAFIPGDGLASGADLYTAALISIFTDAQAGGDDVIPDGTDDRRGWWADPAMGSKLWLRLRMKVSAATQPTIAALVRNDIEQALAWMIEDSVAASTTVTPIWLAANKLGVTVAINRTDGTTMAIAFSRLWETI